MQPHSHTPDEREDRAAIDFLEQFVADRAAGRERTLAEYAAAFARFPARIAREWLLARGEPLQGEQAAPTPAGGEDCIGPYRLERELGRGGQGVVYLAVDTRLGRRVALKVLARDFAALSGPARLRLQREADAIARLEHPGIATIYETGEASGVAFLAMRYVPGGSVQQAIAARLDSGLGPPTRQELPIAVRLCERALRALDAAHRAGIVHRDVKPANLLLAAADEPVLVDFGLATDAAGDTPTLTMPGALFGTLCYLAPERLAGGAADARGDVHALGAVLFELLTLQRPYAAATAAAELQAIAAAPVPDVRQGNAAVSRDLAVVVATALAKAPGDRYQSAAAFADDLARVLARQPIAARRSGAWLRLWRWGQRNPGLAASSTALLLVLAAGLGVTSWLWRESAVALADVKRLADLKLARDLISEAETLWPALPAQQAALLAWQQQQLSLQQRLPVHRQRLAELPPVGTDPTADWEREQLTALLATHRELEAAAVSVAARLVSAADIVRRSLEAPARAWQEAIGRIAASPHYGGLQLRPQLGLVPLGADPDSGLEEFAHCTSGTVPQRGSDGRLRLDGDSAIVLVLVPGGRAVLGAEAAPPADGHPINLDASASPDVGPCYVVQLDAFFLGKHELTQEQWQRQTGRTPSAYRQGGDLEKVAMPRHPVELVSWRDADRVLHQLDLELPSEAQWEWAYRAGTRTPYPYGDDAHALAGHENLADRSAQQLGGRQHWRYIDWLDDGHLVHAPVGSFAPNAYGLCDMGGNVKEWCRDTWEDYGDCAPRPGDGLRLGAHKALRVIRGACFSSWLDEPRAASRGGSDLDTAGAEAGLRAARRLDR